MNVFRFIRSIFRHRRMSVYSRWWIKMERILFMFISLSLFHQVHSADNGLNRNDPLKKHHSTEKYYRLAEINVYVRNKASKDTKFHITGKYGLDGLVSPVKGTLDYPRFSGSDLTGCEKYKNRKFPSKKWIAFVERGNCNFTDKVRIATKVHNASAVVVYADQASKSNAIMNTEGLRNSISVFITYQDGRRVMENLKSGSTVIMHISPGEERTINDSTENNISKTSVLFVSISFIVLMVISLAWLGFYYIQRFRNSHAKERLARRLACAARKAIAKIPQSTVKAGDKLLEGDHDQCAVCIEQYKPHDVVRILPCSHVFHKSCVDPWLQENRSCPICKKDILAAYGMQIGLSQESVHQTAEPRPTSQMVIEDPEASSNGEEARAEVVLLPSFCLHFNVDREESGEYAQATSQLLGSSEGVVHLSSNTSLHSCNGSASASVSRVEERDIQESNGKETTALIEKETSELKSDVEDDDEDNEFHKGGDFNEDKGGGDGRHAVQDGEAEAAAAAPLAHNVEPIDNNQDSGRVLHTEGKSDSHTLDLKEGNS